MRKFCNNGHLVTSHSYQGHMGVKCRGGYTFTRTPKIAENMGGGDKATRCSMGAIPVPKILLITFLETKTIIK